MRCILNLLLICILSVLTIAAPAQQKAKTAFHSLQQVGMINGDGAVSAMIQTVNGLSFDQWFAGAGVGLDFYRYRSVPVFLDVKRYFDLKNRNSLFVYGDGGYNIPWAKRTEPEFTIWSWPTEINNDYKGGAYWDAGIGYAVRFKRNNSMLLSAGYSYKRFSETRTTKTIIGGVAGNIENIDVRRYEYDFRRVMIKIGWEF